MLLSSGLLKLTRRATCCALALAMLVTAMSVLPGEARADDSIFTSSPVVDALEGVPYEYTVTTSVDVTSWGMLDSIMIQPAGDPFNARSWRLTGSPGVGDAGEYPIHIKAEVGGVWYWQNYTLAVHPNAELIITSSPDTNALAGESYSYQVSGAYDIVSATLEGPDWLDITIAGLVYGSPGLSAEGDHQVSVQVSTAWGTAWQNYTLTVSIVFTSSPVTTGQDGELYEYTVTTSANVTSWGLVSAIVNPAGDPFDARSWRLVASPEYDAGAYAVHIKAEIGGKWYWQNYTLIIAPDLNAVFTSTPVLNATANTTYSYQVVTPYSGVTWSIDGPEWLNISSSGLVSGVPPLYTDGSFQVNITAHFAGGYTATQNYTLEVEHQPYTAQDGMAMAFGMLAFIMVISALVGIVAQARRMR